MKLKKGSSSFTIFAALLSDILIMVTKFIASYVTGSPSMFSEGVHSLIDASNTLLLVLGKYRSKKPADEKHNFGYGKELYFWSLMVSILLFGAGGGVSIYEGVMHIKNPEPLKNIKWNIIVLGFAFIFDGLSLWIAYKNFRLKETEKNILSAIKKSKDSATITILVNFIALIGLFIAAAGNIISTMGPSYYIFDGFASVLIGLLLCIGSVLLVNESKELLLGESMGKKAIKKIKEIACMDAVVTDIDEIRSMYFGPEEILLTMNIHFTENLTVKQIHETLEKIKHDIASTYPSVKKLYIKAELDDYD